MGNFLRSFELAQAELKHVRKQNAELRERLGACVEAMRQAIPKVWRCTSLLRPSDPCGSSPPCAACAMRDALAAAEEALEPGALR